jgi:hypothetical protein
MLSPGGLPFCVLASRPRGRVAPVRWPDGHRSRLVQICLDSPPDLHEAEVAFWQAATDWRWSPSQNPPFAGKLYGHTNVQFLLQELGPDDGATCTRAHIDLGTDDLEAEAARLVALGAVRRWDGSGWISLADPNGMLFCTTGNPPD